MQHLVQHDAARRAAYIRARSHARFRARAAILQGFRISVFARAAWQAPCPIGLPMKLLFDSLDAMLSELRNRKVTVVRISPAIEREGGARTGGIPHLTSRIIVTAAIEDHLWSEWRHWVGRAVAEITERGLHLPATLQRKGSEAITAISKHVDDAGFEIREGILAHDTAAMDTFRLPAAGMPFIPSRPAGRPGAEGDQR